MRTIRRTDRVPRDGRPARRRGPGGGGRPADLDPSLQQGGRPAPARHVDPADGLPGARRRQGRPATTSWSPAGSRGRAWPGIGGRRTAGRSTRSIAGSTSRPAGPSPTSTATAISTSSSARTTPARSSTGGRTPGRTTESRASWTRREIESLGRPHAPRPDPRRLRRRRPR